jgi:hypothetical protein
LLPLTDLTHPGWMIISLPGAASSEISVWKKLRKSACARADDPNSNIAAIAAAADRAETVGSVFNPESEFRPTPPASRGRSRSRLRIFVTHELFDWDRGSAR